MALNDTLELIVIGSTGAGAELINRHTYIQVAGSGDDAGVNLIDAWVADAMPAYQDVIADTVSILGFRVRNLTQPTFGTDYTLPTPEQGVITGEVLPPQNAAVISWRTGLIGRRYRGRTFVWPTGENQQNEGQWSNAYVTALTDFGNAALTIDNGAYTYQRCVYSSESETPGVVSTIITSVVVDQFVRGQRRRQVGVGS